MVQGKISTLIIVQHSSCSESQIWKPKMGKTWNMIKLYFLLKNIRLPIFLKNWPLCPRPLALWRRLSMSPNFLKFQIFHNRPVQAVAASATSWPTMNATWLKPLRQTHQKSKVAGLLWKSRENGNCKFSNFLRNKNLSNLWSGLN